MCSWPSGLRRCIKAAVSSEAWVRIPSNTISFFLLLLRLFLCLCLFICIITPHFTTHHNQKSVVVIQGDVKRTKTHTISTRHATITESLKKNQSLFLLLLIRRKTNLHQQILPMLRDRTY